MKNYIAIDIGGTFVKYALINRNGEIIEKNKFETERDSLNLFLESIDSIVECHKNVNGICVSMPGKIDSKNGIALTGGSLHFIDKTNVQSILEDRYHLSVSIANDGHCATIAELWKGSLQDCQNGACFVFGTGIGGGIIVNDQIVEGNHFAAGELSCMITDFSQPDLQHFLGTRCSTKALLRKYSRSKNPTITGYDFFDAVKKNEQDARSIYESFLKEVSSAIYTLQSIIDCKKIAIGGGISSVEFLIQDLNEALDKKIFFF